MKDKALQTASKNLPEQSKSPKAEFLQVAHSDEDKKFLDSFFDKKPFRDEPIGVVSKVLELVTGLRMFVGAIKDVDPKQLQLEAQLIVNNFSFLNSSEVSLAFELFMQNKLMPLDRVLNYPNFSSLFISQILNLYVEYRTQKIDELNYRKKPQIEYKPSAAEQAEDMRYMIEEVYRLLSEGKTYYIVLINTVFNYLYRTKKVAPSIDEIKVAAKYAEDKYINAVRGENIRMIDVLNNTHKGKHKDHLLETFTREYCLIKYFESSPIETILEQITENYFQ